MKTMYSTIICALFILRCTGLIYAANNSLGDVYAVQRDDGTKIVDIYYDLSANDPWESAVYYSIDGGINYTQNSSGFSGDIGADISPGDDRHIIWDACTCLPEIDTECRILVKVTFWVGYESIPNSVKKSILSNEPDLLVSNSETNQEYFSVRTQEDVNINADFPTKTESLVDFFQKRCCHKVIVQSESLPFRLTTLSTPEPETPEENEDQILYSYEGVAHCPTLNEFGMIIFMILLCLTSIITLKSRNSRL